MVDDLVAVGEVAEPLHRDAVVLGDHTHVVESRCATRVDRGVEVVRRGLETSVRHVELRLERRRRRTRLGEQLGGTA